MNSLEREKSVFDAIKNKDWDTALEHASHMPTNFDIWQRLPTASPDGMPEHAARKVLNLMTHRFGQHRQNLPSFLFEYTSNLPSDASHEWLNELARFAVKENDPDVYVANRIMKHPNWKPDEQTKTLQDASGFWHSYEKSVKPHHFAVIKSMFTGQPEDLKDHRGRSGSSEKHIHLIPGLHEHAKAVQDKILKDDSIRKRYINGKPYIKLYRGVNGHYGKAIRRAVGYLDDPTEIKKKKFIIPTAHLTSWTTDPQIAHKFAHNWGDTNEDEPNDKGVTMSQWLPVDSILHSGSGQHDSVIGQDHAHTDESEVVVGHPEGKMEISTTDMSFQDTNPDSGGYYPMLKPKLVKTEEDLFKSAKSKMASAMTAMAMLGIPHATATVPTDSAPQAHQFANANEIVSINKLDDSPDLKPIKMIESSNRKDPIHPLVTHGLNAGTKALGQYGLMPLQIIDTLNYDKHLGNKYPHLASLDYKDDQEKINDAFKKDPNLERSVANSHWKRLHDRFDGNLDKMVYAWNHGITGALNASDEDIQNHPYVKKYYKFKKLLQLEKPKEVIKKSEPNSYLHSIKKFIPLTATEHDKHAVHLINEAIKSGNVHDLSNVGHFTHASFLVGFERDNSWLMKVESVERPGVKSAQKGLQCVKEVAFYIAANRIFDLGQFTPKAILGEIVRDDKNWPTSAIKMFSDQYVLAAGLERQKPGSVHEIMEKYRRSGQLHKMAIMLYILGDVDSHGNNWLTDGNNIKMIDHGTSFADDKFGTHPESGVFIPYILRQGYIRESWPAAEKLKAMPRIDDPKVQEQVRHWVMNLNAQELLKILDKFYIEPKPTLSRLRLVQKLIGEKSGTPDKVINSLWVAASDNKEIKQ